MFPNDTFTYATTRALVATFEPVDTKPTSFTTASKILQWREVMNAEFNALLESSTWTLVPKLLHMNLVGCKWIYRIKKNSNGSISQYKAHPITKGFHQQPSIDYGDTFSLVLKPTTIWTILSLALASN